MIAITPEIIGPGIEEEYADAMERIEVLLRILEPFPCSNDTPEGRLHYQILWFRQEIEAGRLPIPLDRKYRGTLCYLIGSCKVDYLPGIETPMGELNTVLDGKGLIKPRHYPVVIALIDDLLEMIGNPPDISEAEQKFISVTRNIRAGLAENRYKIPLNRMDYPSLIDTIPYTVLKKTLYSWIMFLQLVKPSLPAGGQRSAARGRWLRPTRRNSPGLVKSKASHKVKHDRNHPGNHRPRHRRRVRRRNGAH